MLKNTHSFLHVGKNTCARGSLRSLGRYEVYAGSWWHELQIFVTEMVPERVRDGLVSGGWGKMGEILREREEKMGKK